MSTTGDAISIFYGELLTSPIPLELSFNYCSHKCFYCFANLNKPGRFFDSKATLSMLRRSTIGKGGLVGHLLRNKYPVCCSNRTDPFADSNYKQAVTTMRTMIDMEIPLMMQTRGGQGIDEILKYLPAPSLWYVSVSYLDDEIRKKVEPGAPSVGSRLDLIAKLHALGHKVIIGMNPLVPEWQPDPDVLIETLHAHGADGLWIGWVHFKREQVAEMSAKEEAALSSVIELGSKKGRSQEEIVCMEIALEAAESLGIPYYLPFPRIKIEQPNIWDVYRECYKVFPGWGDFERYAIKSGSDFFTFDDYRDFLLPHFPEGEFSECESYLRLKWAARQTGITKGVRSYEDVLSVLWDYPWYNQCPVFSERFCWAAEPDDVTGELVKLLDENDHPMLVMMDEPSTEFMVDIS